MFQSKSVSLLSSQTCCQFSTRCLLSLFTFNKSRLSTLSAKQLPEFKTVKPLTVISLMLFMHPPKPQHLHVDPAQRKREVPAGSNSPFGSLERDPAPSASLAGRTSHHQCLDQTGDGPQYFITGSNWQNSVTILDM